MMQFTETLTVTLESNINLLVVNFIKFNTQLFIYV